MVSNTWVSKSWLLFFLKVTCVVLLIIAANVMAGWIADALSIEVRPSNEEFLHRTIMVSAVAYAVLMAVPFVPGVEVGLGLIGMLGPPIVPLVYLATLVGLSASFVVGRLLPLAGFYRLLDNLHFNRSSRLLRAIEPMDAQERLSFLLSNAPNRLVPFLLRHRYLALAVALNIPGNFLIGGGGGIALIAGASKLYSVPAFLATIAIAVSPLPLVMLVFGHDNL